jgi:hypothetical protein
MYIALWQVAQYPIQRGDLVESATAARPTNMPPTTSEK